MATKPTKIPEWNTGGANNTEPNAGKKVLGWELNEAPPSSTFNWLLKLLGEWCSYLNAPVGTGEGAGLSATGGSTSGAGLSGTGGASNGHGVIGTGDGTGSGVLGTGGDSGGSGVRGVGGADGGIGVYGFGGIDDGTGIGVYGASTSGHGVVAESDTTSPAASAFRIVPQDAAPSGPNEVGDIYVTTAGKLYICTSAGTPGTWTLVGAQT